MVRSFAIIVALGTCVVSAQFGRGQPRPVEDERAAKASSKSFRLDGGLINSADGQLRCRHQDLTVENPGCSDEIRDGDSVETGQGRAELLLNPGFYLRLDANSKIVVSDTSPTNLKVQVLSGSVIFEIALDESPVWQGAKDNLFAAITVITERDEHTIVRPGAYRFSIEAEGKVTASVLKGLLITDGVPVKSGNSVSAFAGVLGIVKITRGPGDAFDEWSRARASTLVKSNKSLKHTEWDKIMDSGAPLLDPANGNTTERSNDARTVSARSGEITYSEPGTSVKRPNSDWEGLRKSTTMSDGDRLRTELHARAEVHPYPYVYMFVGGGSEFIYHETPDGQVSIEVARGSVVVFIPDIQWKKQSPSVLMMTDAQNSFEVSRNGYYRLNVDSGRDSSMLVYYGSANFAGRMLTAPTKLVRRGGSVLEVGLDRKAGDNLDVWSDRRRALLQSDSRQRLPQGIWFLDSATNEYTFVPASHFFKSPYGGDYSVVFQGEMPTRMRLPPRDPFGRAR